jgi:Protein of unknown function (DUF1573)
MSKDLNSPFIRRHATFLEFGDTNGKGSVDPIAINLCVYVDTISRDLENFGRRKLNLRLALLSSLFLVDFLFTFQAFGQLRWDILEQYQKALPGEKAAIAKFHFVNVGKSSIRVDDLQTSCGCTTASLTKVQYAPGDAGEIEAKFEFGSHFGHQEKTVVVTTSDSPTRPTVLRLTVDIPQAVVFQPEFVFWRAGEALNAKKFRVAVGQGFSVKLLGVASDNPAIHFVVNTITPQREIEVSVTPTEGGHSQNATLSIKTDYPPENPRTYYMYVLVQ